MCPASVLIRCRCCCCTAGRARCSSFSISSRASPIRHASVAMRATPSPWWRRPCRDTASRSSPARSGSAFLKWRIVSPPSCMTCWDIARFGAQGGDWGAAVTSRLGYAHADRMIGIHINLMMAAGRDPAAFPNPNEEERRYLGELAQWMREETGYQWIQGTRPQTLAFGLTDSPAGLAAWIVEKFRAWSDCGGDVERAISRDRMLADIALYWFTGAIGSSFWPYYARLHGAAICLPAIRSRCPPATRNSRAKSSGRRARRRRACSPISAAGASCPRADISPRWNSRSCSPTRCALSSGNCDDAACSDSQSAQIIRHVAEFSQQLGVAEFADHGIAGTAEGDRADAAGGLRQQLRRAATRRTNSGIPPRRPRPASRCRPAGMALRRNR